MAWYKRYLDHKIYYNYRCRKCKAIISKLSDVDPYYFVQEGVLLDNIHICKLPYIHEIDKNEKIFADMISTSDEPLSDTYEIYDTIVDADNTVTVIEIERRENL